MVLLCVDFGSLALGRWGSITQPLDGKGLKLKSSLIILLSKLPWMVWEMETTPLGQHVKKTNSGPAIAHRPRREHCAVSSLHHCSKKTQQLPFILHLQHGWDTHAFWAALEPNTGIQWEPNSVSKILRSRKAELHRRSCCCCQWSKGAPESRSYPWRPNHGCTALGRVPKQAI